MSVDVEGNITLRGTSSVEIWINDQPSNLTEENLKAYIQTLPANAIDRIEVITNPSARYATTADGIINIVMNTKIKRNEFFCFGTNVSSQPYVMPWASYVWKNDKWTVNAYANTYWYHGKGEAHSEKDLYGEDEEGNQVLTSHLKSSMYNNYTTYSPGVNLNLTYTPDKMNTFSLYAMFWDSFGPSEVRQERERVEYIEQSGEYKYSIENKSNSNYLFLPYGLNYQHKFDEEGHNLTLRMNGSITRSALPIDYHKIYTLPSPYERASDVAIGSDTQNTFWIEPNALGSRRARTRLSGLFDLARHQAGKRSGGCSTRMPMRGLADAIGPLLEAAIVELRTVLGSKIDA